MFDLKRVCCLSIVVALVFGSVAGQLSSTNFRAVLLHGQPLVQYGIFLQATYGHTAAGYAFNVPFELQAEVTTASWPAAVAAAAEQYDMVVFPMLDVPPELRAEVSQVEADHPDTAFLHFIGVPVDLPNSRYIVPLLETSLWSLGYLGAAMSDHVCMIGVPDPNSWPNAAYLGAQAARPDVRFTYATRISDINDGTTSLFEQRQDAVTAKAVDIMVAAGCGVVAYVNGDDLGHKLLRDAGVYSLGVTMDMSELYGQNVLQSAPIEYAIPFEAALADYEAGVWFDLESTPRSMLYFANTLSPYSPVVPLEVRNQVDAAVSALGVGLPGWLNVWCGGEQVLEPILPPNVTLTPDGCINPLQAFAMLQSPLLHPNIEFLGLIDIEDQAEDGVSSGVRITLYVLAGVLAVILLLLFVAVLMWRDTAIIHYSSVFFCLVMLVGALLVDVAIFFWIPPHNLANCYLFAWFAAVGACLLVGALLLKTFRLAMIARAQRKMRVVLIPLSNVNLALVLLVLLAVNVLLLCVFSFVDQPETKRVYSDLFAYYLSCDISTASVVAASVLVGLYGVLLLVCCTFTFTARSLPVVFDESTPIFLSCYNMVVSMALIVPLLILLDDYTAKVVVAAVGAMAFGPGTALLIFVPKVFVLLTGKNGSQPHAEYDTRSAEMRTPRSGVSVSAMNSHSPTTGSSSV
eukprot:CAMPEP_0174246178 /NCGR_PEP_ID=MMETSP0417-20130205/41941_1 /TAXON_ID=242541 /ORGANISM="Mayorella sp, Strain BSH-02190019" /LENGTH=686 /DNA_ID=CAMNT_0015326029 /DNA_START=40 /DNA_END=2100 /DNA_ORIENTATION=-